MSADPIYVLDKRLSLYQADDGLKTSTDSVLLAAACPASAGQGVLDLGCGVGSAGLCVLKRVKDTTLCGIDIQEDHIEIARRNGEINALKADFIHGDIRSAENIDTFHHVICNPPYRDAGAYIRSPSAAKDTAIGHDMTLQNWTDFAWHHIKGQGSLTMIHDAAYSDALIRSLYSVHGKRRFGGVDIIPLYPKRGTPAKRVIVRAWKHRKSSSTLSSGLVIHEADGSYTKEANDILRHMASL